MRFIGPCLLIDGSLIAADLHLGYEDRQKGSSGLITNSEQVVAQLNRIIKEASRFERIDQLVLAGDVIDDFALKNLQRRIMITRLLNRLGEAFDLVLIRGNHDSMLSTLHLDTSVRDSFVFASTIVMHGDRPLAAVATRAELEACERIVIGHEHPVLALDDGLRIERFKCFVRIPKVRTSFGEKEVVIAPSAHPDVLGTDVGVRFRTPVLTGSFPDAEVIVVGDPPRPFGALGALFTQE